MIFRRCAFLRAAKSLPLTAFVAAKQLPHLELNLTELVLLALVLLLNGAGVVAVRDEHQTAVHNFNGQCAANIESSLFKTSSR